MPAYAEPLIGEGNFPDGDVEEARADLAWAEKYAVDEHTAVQLYRLAQLLSSWWIQKGRSSLGHRET